MNKRILLIVNELLNHSKEQTMNQLAGKFEVSERTIRNDIHSLNDFLEENNLNKISIGANGVLIKNSDFSTVSRFLYCSVRFLILSFHRCLMMRITLGVAVRLMR